MAACGSREGTQAEESECQRRLSGGIGKAEQRHGQMDRCRTWGPDLAAGSSPACSHLPGGFPVTCVTRALCHITESELGFRLFATQRFLMVKIIAPQISLLPTWISQSNQDIDSFHRIRHQATDPQAEAAESGCSAGGPRVEGALPSGHLRRWREASDLIAGGGCHPRDTGVVPAFQKEGRGRHSGGLGRAAT